MVQVQAIITQLVFDHALKIRVKTEVASSTPASSAVTTPDTASLAESVEGGSASETETETQTAVSETTTPKHKRTSSESGESSTTKASEKAPDADAKSGNLVGKLNNLVTTDLNNLVDGRDFLFLGKPTLAVP